MEMNVIFYPSGYLQLQIADDGDDFCHVYDNPNNLAKDVSALLDGDNAIGWYGNDPDAWVEVEKTPSIRHISMQALPDYLIAFTSGKVTGKRSGIMKSLFIRPLHGGGIGNDRRVIGLFKGVRFAF